MRRFVLGYRRGFTLIEVMVAVMIVSVVIAALLKLRGDTNHLFTQIQKNQQHSSMATLLLWNRQYNLQKSSTNLYNLVDTFDLDDDLRRELKNVKATITFDRVKTIEVDMLTFEIDDTAFQSKDFDIHYNRVILR